MHACVFEKQLTSTLITFILACTNDNDLNCIVSNVLVNANVVEHAHVQGAGILKFEYTFPLFLASTWVCFIKDRTYIGTIA